MHSRKTREPQPIVGSRADWSADRLSASPEWNHRLSDDERGELERLVDDLEEAADGPRYRGVPLERVGPDGFELPRLDPRLTTIRSQLEEGTGAVWLRGFPFDDRSEAECRLMDWAVSTHLGRPVSQSAAGERIFSVRDAGHPDGDPRARGPNTARRLRFHTDRADVVGFLCLRQAREGGENEIASSVGVYNAILKRRPDLLKLLMQPFYYLRHSVDRGNDQPWCRQPVFSFADGQFACCVLRVLIERAHADPRLPDLTPQQVEALDLVESIAGEPGRVLRFRQEPGDLLFMNNWLVLHRRTAFVDHDEPALRRHILRVWLSMPNSRPLDPLFADNFGAVEAGALRGGMLSADGTR